MPPSFPACPSSSGTPVADDDLRGPRETRAAGRRSIEACVTLLAAIEMQHAARERAGALRVSGGIAVEIGIGLNSGEVVEGSIGTEDRVELTVLGDVVNVASRLEGFCKQGRHLKIVISAATYQRVQHLVDAEQMPAPPLKGKRQEVVKYEVIGRRPPA